MTDIVKRLRAESRIIFDDDDFDAIDAQREEAAREIEHLREIMRYIWSHGDEHGKVPHSWGQVYAERFIKLAKQEWDKNDPET
jgi:hypothetical protein